MAELVAHQYDILARKYAQAFINYAGQSLTLELFYDLELLQKKLQKNHSALWLFKFSLISLDDRHLLIKHITDSAGLPQSFENLMQLMARRNRLFLLDHVIGYICSIFLLQRNIEIMNITTAHELTMQEQEKFVSFLKNKTHATIIARMAVDSRLMAGVRAQSNSFFWEYSVQSQLRRLALRSIR